VRRAAAAALVAAVAAGCGGGSDEGPVVRLRDGGGPGRAATEPGRVVLRFVQAARRGDAQQMWSLLSEPTRASIGPRLERFVRETALAIAEDFEDTRDFEIVLSRDLGPRWAIGAVAGVDAPDDDEPEPATFAAALRREDGRWKLELAGVAFAQLDPDPEAESDARPPLHVEAEAGDDVERLLLWVDDAHVQATAHSESPFTAEIEGVLDRDLAPGLHMATAFASTHETAGALAWWFEVRD
jgi:hypothetical protein